MLIKPKKIPEDIKEIFRDEVTKKRIQEHLNNKEDKISEEDLNNIRTDIVADTENNSRLLKEKKI